MSSIRIVTDGSLKNTKVIDPVSGRSLSGVQKVVIHPIKAGDLLIRATVEFIDVELEVQAFYPSLWRRLVLAFSGRRGLHVEKPARGTT